MSSAGSQLTIISAITLPSELSYAQLVISRYIPNLFSIEVSGVFRVGFFHLVSHKCLLMTSFRCRTVSF